MEASLTICSSNETKLAELKIQFPSIITFVCDVSKKNEVVAFADFVLQNFVMEILLGAQHVLLINCV